MVIRSAFPSLTNSFLRLRGSTRIEMKLQSARSLVLKGKKKIKSRAVHAICITPFPLISIEFLSSR